MHQDVFRAIGAAQAQRVRELGNAQTQLQQALVRFTELQEEERGAIAQALHDETIQALLATLWALEELEPSTDAVSRIRRNLEAAVTAVRSMVRDLRPPASSVQITMERRPGQGTVVRSSLPGR
jgi:signal transduction histidine kinase